MSEGRGFSFPYGFALVTYPLLALGIAGTFWWSVACTALATLCAGAFTWQALSLAEYMKIYKNDASLTRLTWVINWLLFFAIPATLLALFGIGRLVVNWLS